jgi:hypothetical protein
LQRHALAQVLGQLHDLDVGKIAQFLRLAATVVDLFQQAADFIGSRLRPDHLVDLVAEPLCRPAKVGLQHLTDVHPRRHTQRVQHDVHRRAVFHVGHVFDGDDLGDHTLVTVTTGHLVAGLQAALDGQVDLDHLLHARGQLIALGKLLLLGFECQVEVLAGLLERLANGFHLGSQTFVGHPDIKPV